MAVKGALLVPYSAVCWWVKGDFNQNAFGICYNHPVFKRKCHALADHCRRLGFPTVVVSMRAMQKLDPVRDSRITWIIFAFDIPPASLPERYVIYNAEPLTQEYWRVKVQWPAIMQNALAIWSYDRSDTAFFESLKRNYRFVPFGFYDYWEDDFFRQKRRSERTQDIDVLFFGDLNERRHLILTNLRSAGLKVHVVDKNNPRWGRALDRLVLRSKIVLGLHYYDDPITHVADYARVDVYLANRVFVLHEKPSLESSDPEFEKHVATAESDELIERCVYFAGNPEARARWAESSQAWFKSHMDMRRHLTSEVFTELLAR